MMNRYQTETKDQSRRPILPQVIQVEGEKNMHTKLITAAGALAIAAVTLTGVGIANAATAQTPAEAQPAAVQQLAPQTSAGSVLTPLEAVAATAPQPATTHGTGELTIRFVDSSGNPVPGIRFVAYGWYGPTPGGTTRDLTTDSDGRATWSLDGYGWTIGSTTSGDDDWPLWFNPAGGATYTPAPDGSSRVVGQSAGEIIIDGDGTSLRQNIAVPGDWIVSKSPSFVEIRLP